MAVARSRVRRRSGRVHPIRATGLPGRDICGDEAGGENDQAEQQRHGDEGQRIDRGQVGIHPGGEPKGNEDERQSSDGAGGRYPHAIPNEQAEAAPGTAHLFIINPLTGQGMDNLFSTHPNTDNRVAELERLAAELGAGRAQSYAPPPSAGTPRGPWGAAPDRPRGPWG